MNGPVFSLLGQDSAAHHLEAAVVAGRVHHALLFWGPDGVGKFAAALSLAIRLACRKSKGGAACGSCASCRKSKHGHLPDTVVLDPEEKVIRVDDIRESVRSLQIAPLEAPFKTMIIRDADRMNPSAQNALLKTLEEPPGSAHIILTASRPDVLLPTVLSRCHRVAFQPIPGPLLAEKVREVRGFDEPSALLTAALSKGSLGRALTIDVEAQKLLRERAVELDRSLGPKRPSGANEALLMAESLGDDGFLEVLDMLGVWLRDQILLKLHDTSDEIANADRRDELLQLADARSLSEILRRARALELTRREATSPYNPNRRIVAEQLCLALAGEVYLPSTSELS